MSNLIKTRPLILILMISGVMAIVSYFALERSIIPTEPEIMPWIGQDQCKDLAIAGIRCQMVNANRAYVHIYLWISAAIFTVDLLILAIVSIINLMRRKKLSNA